MKYVVSDKVALRSWRLVPHAYYVYGYEYAQKLNPEAFDVLSRCDGTQDIPASPLLDKLVESGFCRAAAPDETWSEWSRPRKYENRYFPRLNWAITGKCNMNCRHCFMAADNSPMMGEFSWEECMNLLDGCEECGIQTLTLTGGEPMLHPRFMDIVRECARRRLCIGEINTNGSFLTEEILDEFRALGFNTEFKVSFDGLGHHDWLRGVPHAEETALRALRLVKEKGFPARAQTNVHRGNIHVMYDTVKLLDEMGVDEVRIIRTTETPRWRENGGDATLGILEYYGEMLKLVDALLQSGCKIRVDVWQFLHYDPAALTYSYHPVQVQCSRYKGSIPACKGARGTVAISYNGEIYPCNQTSGTFASMGISFGNVKQGPLQKLLTSGDYLGKVTLPVEQVRAENPACQSCQYWNCCMGGCRAISLAFTKNYNHLDPSKCAFFKGGWMEEIDRVFAAAPGTYRCLSETGSMDKSGEPENMGKVVARLGSYA